MTVARLKLSWHKVQRCCLSLSLRSQDFIHSFPPTPGKCFQEPPNKFLPKDRWKATPRDELVVPNDGIATDCRSSWRWTDSYRYSSSSSPTAGSVGSEFSRAVLVYCFAVASYLFAQDTSRLHLLPVNESLGASFGSLVDRQQQGIFMSAPLMRVGGVTMSMTSTCDDCLFAGTLPVAALPQQPHFSNLQPECGTERPLPNRQSTSQPQCNKTCE